MKNTYIYSSKIHWTWNTKGKLNCTKESSLWNHHIFVFSRHWSLSSFNGDERHLDHNRDIINLFLPFYLLSQHNHTFLLHAFTWTSHNHPLCCCFPFHYFLSRKFLSIIYSPKSLERHGVCVNAAHTCCLCPICKEKVKAKSSRCTVTLQRGWGIGKLLRASEFNGSMASNLVQELRI